MSSNPALLPSPTDCSTPKDGSVHIGERRVACGILRRGEVTLVIDGGGNDTVLDLGFSHDDVVTQLCASDGQDH
jgi:hypothetical protein